MAADVAAIVPATVTLGMSRRRDGDAQRSAFADADARYHQHELEILAEAGQEREQHFVGHDIDLGL
ncbi:hypothetical protein D3C71_2146820 [compost metagenome]